MIWTHKLSTENHQGLRISGGPIRIPIPIGPIGGPIAGPIIGRIPETENYVNETDMKQIRSQQKSFFL